MAFPLAPVFSAHTDTARALGHTGMAAVVVSVALIGVLHLLTPDLPPAWTMISHYALGQFRPLFDAGVLVLAAGSVAVLAAAMRVGLLRDSPATVALMGVWCAGMLLVVAFPTCDCRTEITAGGFVHAVASMTAFLALPAAALRLGLRWHGHAGSAGPAQSVRVLGAVSLVLLAPLPLALVPVAALTGPLWEIIPFGLIERGLMVAELAMLLTIGRWTTRIPCIASSAQDPLASRPSHSLDGLRG